MLSSAIKNVLDLFYKILTAMTNNGILKTFLFTYEEANSLVFEEQFLINAVDMLDDIKKLFYKLHAELCKQQTFLDDDLNLFASNYRAGSSIDFSLYNAATNFSASNQHHLRESGDLLFQQFGNIVSEIGLLEERLAASNTTSGLETTGDDDCWLNNDDISTSTEQQRQNLVSMLNVNFPNESDKKFGGGETVSSVSEERIVCDEIIRELNENELCNSFTDSYEELSENLFTPNNDVYTAATRNNNSHNLLLSSSINVEDDDDELLRRLATERDDESVVECRRVNILPKSAEELLINKDDSKYSVHNAENDVLSSQWTDKIFDHSTTDVCNLLQFDHQEVQVRGFDSTEDKRSPLPTENRAENTANSPDKENIENYQQRLADVVDCDDTDLGKYRCKECDKTFPTKIKLNLHIESHSPVQFVCTLCGKKFTSQQFLNTHKKTIHKSNSVSCFKCNSTFKTRSKLVHHLKIAHSGVRLPCVVKGCNKTFTSYTSIWQHVKWSHNGFKKLKCQICGKELARRDSLNRHMSMVHSITSAEGIKPYKCGLCKRSFAAKLNYKQHLETHVQDHSKYSCTSCGQLFNHPDLLKRHHVKVHSTRIGYTCALCDRTFTLKRNLINHQLKHNDDDSSSANQIECEICGKKFKSLSTLSFHTKMHEGKFMFKCHICGKEFVRRCHYKDHMLCHSDNRPYKCPVCPSSFKSSKYLRGHGRRLHKHLPNYKTLFDVVLSHDTSIIENDIDNTNNNHGRDVYDDRRNNDTIDKFIDNTIDSSNCSSSSSSSSIISSGSSDDAICSDIDGVFINSEDKFDDLTNLSLNINYIDDDVSFNDISLCQMQFDLIY